MADLQRPKKYLRPAYNPARFPEHHLLYKELIPYYDFLHNIGFTNLPSQLNIPQTGLHLPISSSPSHRTLFTPLELRYIAGSSPASSSAKSGSYSNVSNVNPISYSNVSGNPNAPTERDVLPSDALRHLYRLAERVYSHLNVVMDGKANGTSPTTGTKGQNGKLTGDKSIEITARPAARDGSMLAPGRYSTETRVNIHFILFAYDLRIYLTFLGGSSVISNLVAPLMAVVYGNLLSATRYPHYTARIL